VTKAETIATGLIVGILCPLCTFILCWWAPATLNFYLPVPERWIATSALSGLAVGIGLDVLYLKRWIPDFYKVDMKLLVLIYLFCSAMAAAFFMGMPLGNLVLGILAGAYMGRRAYHIGQSGISFPKTTNRFITFTALLTGVWALWIGLLALNDESVITLLRAAPGLAWVPLAGPTGIELVILLTIVLMAVQYMCARAAAWFMFSLE
jgi:hypothetical protein